MISLVSSRVSGGVSGEVSGMSSGNMSVSCFLEVSFLLFKSKMQVIFCCIFANFANEVS